MKEHLSFMQIRKRYFEDASPDYYFIFGVYYKKYEFSSDGKIWFYPAYRVSYLQDQKWFIKSQMLYDYLSQ